MYTFHPLADVPADHSGFWIIAIILGVLLIISIFNDLEAFFRLFFVFSVVMGITYMVSYRWTDQTTTVYKNEPVHATFAGYAPEGYREKSGKSHVDRHFVYVIYEVNGDPVLLRAETGVTYPKIATLYKN